MASVRGAVAVLGSPARPRRTSSTIARARSTAAGGTARPVASWSRIAARRWRSVSSRSARSMTTAWWPVKRPRRCHSPAGPAAAVTESVSAQSGSAPSTSARAAMTRTSERNCSNVVECARVSSSASAATSPSRVREEQTASSAAAWSMLSEPDAIAEANPGNSARQRPRRTSRDPVARGARVAAASQPCATSPVAATDAPLVSTTAIPAAIAASRRRRAVSSSSTVANRADPSSSDHSSPRRCSAARARSRAGWPASSGGATRSRSHRRRRRVSSASPERRARHRAATASGDSSTTTSPVSGSTATSAGAARPSFP